MLWVELRKPWETWETSRLQLHCLLGLHKHTGSKWYVQNDCVMHMVVPQKEPFNTTWSDLYGQLIITPIRYQCRCRSKNNMLP